MGEEALWVLPKKISRCSGTFRANLTNLDYPSEKMFLLLHVLLKLIFIYTLVFVRVRVHQFFNWYYTFNFMSYI